jgi:hypothetical protein
MTSEITYDECIKNGLFKTQKNYLKFSMAYIFVLSTSLLYLLKKPVMEFFLNGNRELPEDMIMPFDTSGIFVYPIILIWTLLTQILIISSSMFNDIFTYGLIVYLSMEFKVLSVKFKDLKEIKDEEQLKLLIKDYVQQHNSLFNIVHDVQKILSPGFFVTFCLSSFLICFTAFQAILYSDLIQMSLDALFCVVIANVIFFQCFFGQMLQDASYEVFNGAANCGWENWKDEKLRKHIIIILCRSQQMAYFSILKFSKISLQQFWTVINLFFHKHS